MPYQRLAVGVCLVLAPPWGPPLGAAHPQRPATAQQPPPPARPATPAPSTPSKTGQVRLMTNADVIALAKAKASDQSILDAIRSAKEKHFETDAGAVAKLKRAGVSENIIAELRRVVAEQAARSVLAHAKTAVLVNHLDANAPGGGSPDRQFRDLRAQVIAWKRFKVAERGRLPDVSVTFGPAYSATVRRRMSGPVLWSGSGDSWATVMARMKSEIPPQTPTVCVAVWCR